MRYDYALAIEYDGSEFSGWQSQSHHVKTIQTYLEQALSHIANQTISVSCAGRTDRGVHALCQVVSFSTDVSRPLSAWVFGTNTHLPSSIRVFKAWSVDNQFHARYSALSRRYCYYLYESSVASSCWDRCMTRQYSQLSSDKMHEAAQYLIGEHNFQSFRAKDCQSKTAIRRVTALNVIRQGDKIVIDITANAFLHHMVRNIVGVLLEVGHNRRETHWVKDVLQQTNREAAASTAPPNGLFLVEIQYPEATGVGIISRLPIFDLRHTACYDFRACRRR